MVVFLNSKLCFHYPHGVKSKLGKYKHKHMSSSWFDKKFLVPVRVRLVAMIVDQEYGDKALKEGTCCLLMT